MLKMIGRLSTNPTVVAGVVTAIATIGAGWIASVYSENQLEANLIIEAVKVCDKTQVKNNITALMAAGFLPQHSTRLNFVVNNGGFDKLIPPEYCRHANQSSD